MTNQTSATKWIVIAVGGSLAFVFACLFFFPNYNVWQQGRRGEAALARAQSEKLVAVQSAKAKSESAALLGEAEVVRAEKTAEAVQVLGAALEANPLYVQYLFVQALSESEAEGNNTIIYLPGDQLLPFAEALETGRVANLELDESLAPLVEGAISTKVDEP